LKATGQNTWAVMRDLREAKYDPLRYLYASPDRTNQSNIQTPTGERKEAGNWEL